MEYKHSSCTLALQCWILFSTCKSAQLSCCQVDLILFHGKNQSWTAGLSVQARMFIGRVAQCTAACSEIAAICHLFWHMVLLRQWQKLRIVTNLPTCEPIFRSDMAETVYNFEAKDSQGASVSLDTFKGKVILVVNVASKWAYCCFVNRLLKSFL